MSVVVMGVDLPEDCDSCWLPGKHCNLWLQTDVGKRHKDCPIHPLPEKHGRLIDADELDETFSRLNDDGWQLTRGDHKRMESVLFEMPTIVEAEGD